MKKRARGRVQRIIAQPYLAPLFGDPVTTWHRWFAWYPVQTADHGWRYLTPIWRRRIQLHLHLTGWPEQWWQYAADPHREGWRPVTLPSAPETPLPPSTSLVIKDSGVNAATLERDPYRPYPWWTRIWPLGRIYFSGWERGQESGIDRGRIQMGSKPQ